MTGMNDQMEEEPEAEDAEWMTPASPRAGSRAEAQESQNGPSDVDVKKWGFTPVQEGSLEDEEELKRLHKLRKQQHRMEQENAMLRLEVQSVSGIRLASIKVAPRHRLRDIAQAISKTACVDHAGLVLSHGSEVLDFSMTAQEAGLKDGSTITALRSPELVVAVGHEDGSVGLWSAETGRHERTVHGKRGAILSLAFSPRGSLLLTGCMDGTMSVWSLATGRLEVLFQGHRGPVTCVCWSHDGATVLSGSADTSVRIWQSTNGDCLGILANHTAALGAIGLAPDGQHLVTGSSDKTAKLWQLERKKCIANFEGHADDITCLAFSETDEPVLVATGSEDSTVRVWTAKENGKCWRKLKGHKGPVRSVVFLSMEALTEQIVVGVADGSGLLWDVRNAVTVRHFGSHNGPELLCLASSPGSSMVGIGSQDGSVQLWMASTGHKSYRLQPESNDETSMRAPAVHCLAFSAGPSTAPAAKAKVRRKPEEVGRQDWHKFGGLFEQQKQQKISPQSHSPSSPRSPFLAQRQQELRARHRQPPQPPQAHHHDDFQHQQHHPHHSPYSHTSHPHSPKSQQSPHSPHSPISPHSPVSPQSPQSPVSPRSTHSNALHWQRDHPHTSHSGSKLHTPQPNSHSASHLHTPQPVYLQAQQPHSQSSSHLQTPPVKNADGKFHASPQSSQSDANFRLPQISDRAEHNLRTKPGDPRQIPPAPPMSSAEKVAAAMAS
mmetsp:Transcript_69294/g.122652  ORF Transcript_69294/g.122652 Transcript_69294/m.122652 type:complete len:721 (-) Transcript_69294:75-2237(-)